MTPGARIQAAIDCLDRIVAGDAAERVLTRWARAARHAGSKDRAAVRDHVFDALRRFRSTTALGGGGDGRARMIGLIRTRGGDPAALFTGEGYGPAPLTTAERRAPDIADPLIALDCPDELADDLQSSLGPRFGAVMEALRHRAPVFLRVNAARTDPSAAMASLAAEGIESRPHPLSPTALEVLTRPRAVAASAAFRDGLVEVQDAASQAVVDALPLADGMRVLDFCAGGGGKTLAMAARADLRVTAHDAAPARMADLPARAARAGIAVDIAAPDAPGARAFDLVLADAPCSGSGAWRRSPEAKMRADRAMLDRMTALQDAVLDRAARHVAPGGWLAYATCSLIRAENDARLNAFLDRQTGWTEGARRTFTPLDGGDGFFLGLVRAGGTRES